MRNRWGEDPGRLRDLKAVESRFAAEVRRRRQELGLSIRGLAQAVRVSHATVQQWENGTSTPGPGDLLFLAEALGLPLAKLVRR